MFIFSYVLVVLLLRISKGTGFQAPRSMPLGPAGPVPGFTSLVVAEMTGTLGSGRLKLSRCITKQKKHNNKHTAPWGGGNKTFLIVEENSLESTEIKECSHCHLCPSNVSWRSKGHVFYRSTLFMPLTQCIWRYIVYAHSR